MLSARELSRELPTKAQTWVNRRLQFTHGYDIVMSLVSKTTGDGIPRYVLDNIPARSSLGLKITRPEIYYGESMRGYRIVGTKVREFDYPKGDDNVYASYAGTGGIPLDSFWKRMLFAWTQQDASILLTSYLEPQSRIQLWRRVRDRVAQIAPFLRLDKDPYPVVSGGRLYWIECLYGFKLLSVFESIECDAATRAARGGLQDRPRGQNDAATENDRSHRTGVARAADLHPEFSEGGHRHV